MLLVQEFLKNHTFKELQEQHGVYASFCKNGRKFSLNYDQIESINSDLLSQQCRGLILSNINDISYLNQAIKTNSKLDYSNICPGETKIIAYPMNRFFNHFQGEASDINWKDNNLAVMEKLDGTCTILYFDKFENNWFVATRSVPEADINLDNGIFTFRTLFEKAIKETVRCSFDEYVLNLDKGVTYCFELTSPYNRIVCDYKETSLTLIAARKIDNISEIDIYAINSFGIPKVKKYNLNSLESIINWVGTLNPIDHEGVVVKDSQFNRIKVKNPSYLAFSRVKDFVVSSKRNCMELVLLEKDDDVRSLLLPEVIELIDNMKNGLIAIIHKHDKLFAELKEKATNKKEFALLVQELERSDKNIWAAPLYSIYNGKSLSTKEFILSSKKEGTWSNNILDKLIDMSKND